MRYPFKKGLRPTAAVEGGVYKEIRGLKQERAAPKRHPFCKVQYIQSLTAGLTPVANAVMVMDRADAVAVRTGISNGGAQDGQSDGGEDDFLHDGSLFDDSANRFQSNLTV
jgi:hypothetical protein